MPFLYNFLLTLWLNADSPIILFTFTFFIFIFSGWKKERDWGASCVLWVSFVDVLRLSVNLSICLPGLGQWGEQFLLFSGPSLS